MSLAMILAIVVPKIQRSSRLQRYLVSLRWSPYAARAAKWVRTRRYPDPVTIQHRTELLSCWDLCRSWRPACFTSTWTQAGRLAAADLCPQSHSAKLSSRPWRQLASKASSIDWARRGAPGCHRTDERCLQCPCVLFVRKRKSRRRQELSWVPDGMVYIKGSSEIQLSLPFGPFSWAFRILLIRF